MKTFKTTISIIILLVMAVLCQQIIRNATKNQNNKIEYAELNHIRYGLLSIDNWKEKMQTIVTDEIDNLDITKDNEKDLKKTVEKQLIVLIDKINLQIKKSNKGSFKGAIKQSFVDLFISMDDIKKGVPMYADAMIKEMKKPQTQGKVKDMLKDKLNEYINQTFDQQDMSQVNRILLKTSALDIEDARTKIATEIAHRYHRISQEAMAIISLAIILFMIPSLDNENLPAPQYLAMVAALVVLLICGVTTPMIDMEAKISQMTFTLLDHPVTFENQVLYFQSKSVLDVFWIMITHHSIQMKFVGILMVTFSIVFPVCKLLSSAAYYYNFRNLKTNKWIQFFVLHSGKWSMADVLVVAIFMAFIGFNGIISSQFGKLGTTSKELVVLTTNGTSLQPGFYVFLTYAILALILSVYLTRTPHGKKMEV
ncbi:MAG: paraquat-inducible protein A [Rhizobacter sp.]|nr:paraquat-inducible protein A [Bacteriovorax sp.]